MTDTILIVDDEDSVRQTFQEWLAGRPDLNVVVAGDSATALQLANQQVIDLAILDWNLGAGQNGLQLLEDLHVFQPEMTAMLVTGFAHQATPLQALRMGVRDYLDKNAHLTREDFLASVDRLLAGIRPRKRERLVQQGLARFRQAVAELLPRVQTAAHWRDWPSLHHSSVTLLRLFRSLTKCRSALLWLRTSAAGRRGLSQEQYWNDLGEVIETAASGSGCSLAAAASAMPQAISVVPCAELPTQGITLFGPELSSQHVLTCRLDLPHGCLGVIELLDPERAAVAVPLAEALRPVASLLLGFALEELSVHQLLWQALEAAMQVSALHESSETQTSKATFDALTNSALPEAFRASLEPLERPEVKELAVLLRRLSDRHGPVAISSGLRLLHELERVLNQVTGGEG